jgi:phosphodiesterase/alkaline phosphatase D-like protein
MNIRRLTSTSAVVLGLLGGASGLLAPSALAAEAPTVNDQPPSISDVTRTTVLLSGTLNPEGAETAYRFVYVDAGEYEPLAANPYENGASTAVASVAASSGDEAVGPLPLSGLRAGTTYHYALEASNEAGTAIGPDYTFATAEPTPPIVVTGGASNVSQTGATIMGTVNPRGIQTSYEFDLGTDTSYGGARIFGSAGADAGTETIALNLNDLRPGTTYHYRIAATNQDGTTYGADQTFTTPSAEAPISQPVALPLIATPAIAFPTETGTVIKTSTTKKAHKKSKHKATAKHKKRKAGKKGKKDKR